MRHNKCLVRMSWSELVEKGEQAVGCLVGAGLRARRAGAGNGSFLERHVGVLWRSQILQLSECLHEGPGLALSSMSAGPCWRRL